MKLTNDEKRILVDDIYEIFDKNNFDPRIQEKLDAIAVRWERSTDKAVLDMYNIIPQSFQILKVFDSKLYSKLELELNYRTEDCYKFLNNTYSLKRSISKTTIKNIIDKVLLNIKLGANKNINLKELIIKECTKQSLKSSE